MLQVFVQRHRLPGSRGFATCRLGRRDRSEFDASDVDVDLRRVLCIRDSSQPVVLRVRANRCRPERVWRCAPWRGRVLHRRWARRNGRNRLRSCGRFVMCDVWCVPVHVCRRWRQEAVTRWWGKGFIGELGQQPRPMCVLVGTRCVARLPHDGIGCRYRRSCRCIARCTARRRIRDIANRDAGRIHSVPDPRQDIDVWFPRLRSRNDGQRAQPRHRIQDAIGELAEIAGHHPILSR